MVRTIIHGARIEGEGVQMGFYCGGGGGGKVDRGCCFYRHTVKFLW